ncbi:unnamed protein product [Miscanthus lutarioriparius]|uniref:Uncharacterized protein n=1 Tax=Miscanthus lutarioriparius TaxID=422564 RepID=A0A811RWF7_9POAL|nr:unnamed protein product [Miscanthus lutarioriparius]
MADSLPPWARRKIDVICRKFFWAGTDASVRGKCMVAWESACKPTELGGLGITDLKLAGYALQSRWLWLQKTDNDRAWSQLPIRTDPQVQAFFKASTFTVLGDGNLALFWEDRWINGQSASDLAPTLSQLVPRRTRQRQTVRQGINGRQWVRAITGGLSIPANFDYFTLWDAVEVTILTDQPDRTVWRNSNKQSLTFQQIPSYNEHL